MGSEPLPDTRIPGAYGKNASCVQPPEGGRGNPRNTLENAAKIVGIRKAGRKGNILHASGLCLEQILGGIDPAGIQVFHDAGICILLEYMAEIVGADMQRL